MKATVKTLAKESRSVPCWAQIVIAAHLAAASAAGVYANENGEQIPVAVSHAARMQSRRYFCWQEDGANDYAADNRHAERNNIGYTDLFTEIEFDPAVEALKQAFEDARIVWEYTGVSYEPDTRLFHHTWEWEVRA